MSPVEIGILGCILLFVLIFVGLPVAFTMAIVGFIGFALVVNLNAAVSMMTMDFYSTFSDYGLTVIPLFVLMGQVAFHAGISRRLFNAAYHWLGALPGGLAMATVGACTAFGAICGSGPATSATMAAVAMPEMKRYKYDMELACGSVASGGTLGMLIPPSVVFIVYGLLTEQSIGKLFISGIVPGLLIAFMFCIVIYLNCKLRPHIAPPAPTILLEGEVHLSARRDGNAGPVPPGHRRHVHRTVHADGGRRDRRRRHDTSVPGKTATAGEEDHSIAERDRPHLLHGDDHRRGRRSFSASSWP